MQRFAVWACLSAAIVLAASWSATQFIAEIFGSQAALGPPLFTKGRVAIYPKRRAPACCVRKTKAGFLRCGCACGTLARTLGREAAGAVLVRRRMSEKRANRPCGGAGGAADNTDEVRLAALEQFSNMAAKAGSWKLFGARFLAEIWPLELALQTSETTRVWLRIATEAEFDFPRIARAVVASPVLLPLDDLDTFLWTMHERPDRKPIAAEYPREALALMNAVVDEGRQLPPYNLVGALEMMAEADPSPRQDTLDAVAKRGPP